MRLDLKGPNPTLSEFALAARANPGMEAVTRDDVMEAAIHRGVPVVEGRIRKGPHGPHGSDAFADVLFAMHHLQEKA